MLFWTSRHCVPGRLAFFRSVVLKLAAALAVVCCCACSNDQVSKGNEALRIGDFERAVSFFTKVLDNDPGHRDARYGLALAYYAIAEEKERLNLPTLPLWERAAHEFKILAKVDSTGSINAMRSTCLFYLARATMLANPKVNVLSLLDRSIMLDSLNFFSYNLKALILESTGRSEDAKKIYSYIVTAEPSFASAYVNLGNLYWAEGDVEQAWDIWSLGHKALPEDPALAHWTQVAEDSLKALVDSGEL